MVRAVSLGRAWSAVAGFAEVVLDLGSDPLMAADRPRRSGNVEHAPVAESAAWGIGIIDDQGEALRALRRLVPAKHRCLVGAIAGILRRDCAAVLKGVAGEAEFRQSSALHGRCSVRFTRFAIARAAARERD